MTDYGNLDHPLTHSEMTAWQSCHRGWWLSEYRKLRRVHDYASLPSIGNLYHSGLEKLYKGELTDPAAYVRSLMDGLMADNPEQGDQILKDGELAAIMLEGYMDWREQEGADVGLRIIGVEETLEMPVGPYVLHSKIDARVQREWDDAHLQLEHKTVTNLGDIPKYAQDAPQFLTYDLQAYLWAKAQEDDSLRTDGVLLNMARRVKRTSRANPPFYGRHEVRHNVEQLRAHYKHIISIGDEIARATERLDAGEDPHLVVPPSPGRNHTYGCRCAPITTMFDDGSDVEAFLAEFYEPYDPRARYADAPAGS